MLRPNTVVSNLNHPVAAQEFLYCDDTRDALISGGHLGFSQPAKSVTDQASMASELHGHRQEFGARYAETT